MKDLRGEVMILQACKEHIGSLKVIDDEKSKK
jgi:hypothetical protein